MLHMNGRRNFQAIQMAKFKRSLLKSKQYLALAKSPSENLQICIPQNVKRVFYSVCKFKYQQYMCLGAFPESFALDPILTNFLESYCSDFYIDGNLRKSSFWISKNYRFFVKKQVQNFGLKKLSLLKLHILAARKKSS